MEVRVNGEVVKIFEGAKVKDVVRRFSTKEYNEILQGKKKIVDARGHQVGLDGELSGLEEFQIRETNQ